MAMDLREYFRLRCSELLVFERDMWRMNNEMIRDTQNAKLKELFAHHGEPSRRQISNLEQVVDRLGGFIGPEENLVVLGMARMHQTFMDMRPPQPIVDLHNALEVEKVERMLMGAYDGLIKTAKQLGENEIAELLLNNYIGEERMCSVLEGEIPRLLAEMGEQRRAA